jgi:uncharacterized membrane protein
MVKKKNNINERLLISILHFTSHFLVLVFMTWFLFFTYTGIFFKKVGIYIVGSILILICYLLIDFWKEETKRTLE